MVSKVDEFNTVLLALDENEISDILNALRYIGNDDLACEVEEVVFGGCDECDCGDEVKSQLASLIFDIDTSSVIDATEQLNKLTEALERAANAADLFEGAYK